MALGLTVHSTAENETASDVGTGPYATGTFTPSNDSLLVAMITWQNNDTDNITLTPSGGSLTWTKRADSVAGTGNFIAVAEVWTAPVTTGASMTVSWAKSAGNFGVVSMSAVSFTGYNTSDPVGLTHAAKGGSRSGAYSGSLSGTTASDSYVIGCATTDEGTNTPGTGWTGYYDAVSNWMEYVHQYRTGALTAFDLDALTTSFSYAAAAIEVKAAAAAGAARFTGTALTLGRQLHRPGLVYARRPAIIRPHLILPCKAA